MRLSIKDILAVPHVEQRHFTSLRGRSINGVSTDSRTVQPGNLFFALRGENFDGHRFVDEACAKGALAAVVDQKGLAHVRGAMPLLIVPDTTVALGMAAMAYRSRFDIPLLAVAGSNGKTTTKEMIAAVLRMKFSVLSTEGNLNNHIGVPLTLFRLERRHEVAVVELGTNHPGELARLCAIARPTMGLITNIGHEHLEFFGSLDGVQKEEGMLFETLRGMPVRTTAFVNADDARVVDAVPRGLHTVTYGAGRRAAVRGTVVSRTERGTAVLEFVGGRVKKPVRVSLAIPGDHNALNALAAAAVGMTLLVPARSIKQALEKFQAASKRMEVLAYRGVTILNDAYNANPDSMLAALHTLAAAPVPGKRIAVLGDMRELGEYGPEEHARIGREAAALGIDYVLTYGALARQIHDAAQGTFAVHYDQKNIMAEYLAELVSPGDIVLVKASRGLKMEDVVTFLAERLQTTVPMYASRKNRGPVACCITCWTCLNACIIRRALALSGT